MAIREISLKNYRSLQNTRISFNSGINLITGANGAGKTSLLEAIYYVAQGRSFQTHNLNEIVRHGEKEAIVFARFEGHQCGIRRFNGGNEIRLDNKNVNRLSDLIKKNPIRVLDSKTYQLAVSKPSDRREFIDWSLFHVEHSFREFWQNYRTTLKQRNQILKDKRNIELLDYWDVNLVKISKLLSEKRRLFCERLNRLLLSDFAALIQDLEIAIEYRVGWDSNMELGEVYKKQRERELRYGYTLYGIQRDTIKITSKGHSSNSVLSRGQLKRLSIALILSQVKLVMESTAQSVIVLIDDLTSELDSKAVELIRNKLQNMDIQVFLTDIGNKSIDLGNDQVYSLFHVEHGMIRPV
jgi:DNA replication and repair protein RecF